MEHLESLVEVLTKAETGPLIDEREFEAKIVAPTAQRLLREYDIRDSGDVVVPSDDNAADRLFEAGMEFAVEVGMLCTDTSRRILWTREEYEAGLRRCLGEAVLGEGADAVVVRARMPEDQTPLITLGGPYGIEVPEEMFVPLMLSYAQEDLIDVIDNPTLASVYGHRPKAGSPWEVVGGWREAALSMDVIRRAGRPGMCVAGVELSPTALGEISASSWGGFRATDLHHAAGVSEFKTNYESLAKVAHIWHIEGALYAFMASIFGGFMGGAEGVALGLTAAGIVLNQNYLPTVMSLSSVHPFLQCTTTRDLLWAISIAAQALSRNTDLLFSSLVRSSAGPGTKTMLYENAAFAVVSTVCGHAFIQSCMAAGGTHARHASGLDAKISAEVSRATLGMSRDQGNEIVLTLLGEYEPQLEARDPGRPFEEVYHVDAVRPTPEWQRTYDEVRKDLVNWGLSLEQDQ